MSHSLDLRKKVVELYQENPCFRAVGKILRLPHATARNLVGLWQKTGSLEPQYQNCGRPPALGEPEKQRLRQWLEEENGLTLKELQQRLAGHGVAVSHATIDNTLAAMKITRKKKRRSPKKGTGRMSGKNGSGGFPKA